jgi:hypothetical protein
MSCVQDPRDINGIITPTLRRFPSLGPWPTGFINKPLSGGYGTYTVYPVFVPERGLNPDNYYKFYIITMFITNMPDASNTQNPLSDPKTKNIMTVINNSGNFNYTIWYEITITALKDQFIFKNLPSSGTITNTRISFAVIGV